METPLAKSLMFSVNKFEEQKIPMHAHMAIMHDKMLDVHFEGLIIIIKVNLAAREADTPSIIPKPKMEWTTEDRRTNNLNNIAKDLLFKAINVWDSLILIGEGNE